MKCPNCGQICRTEREFCALCGAPLKRKRGRGLLIALLLLVLILAGLAAYFFLLKEPTALAEVEEYPAELRLEPAPAEPAESPEPTPRDDILWDNVARLEVRDSYTLALCRDGTVKLAGQSASPEFGFDLFDWTDIRQLVPTDFFIAGLTGSGRVRLTGEVSGYEDAARWTEVSSLCYDAGTLFGLTEDGRVLAAGPNLRFDPSGISGIVRLIPCECDTLAVAEDGRVNLLRRDSRLWDAGGRFHVADAVWNNDFAFYLMEDGSIQAGDAFRTCVQDFGWPNPFFSWTGVKQLILGDKFALGLTEDGRVLSAACIPGDLAPDTSGWSNVVQLLLDRERNIAYGVTGDGRVLIASASAGREDLPAAAWQDVRQLQISANYTAAITGDGRVLTFAWPEAPAELNASDWEQVSAIALSSGHLAALLEDGSVLTTGDNSRGQCG